MTNPLFKHIAIIGLGQMGASLGLALKRGGLIGTVAGYDLHPDHSATALSIEAIDSLSPTPAAAVRNADLVILCTPVGAYGAILHAIRDYLKPGAVITDIGSIKAQAIRDVSPLLPDHALFIPSHPIAGSEKVGPANARPDFFDRHLFLITPADTQHNTMVERIGQLWQSTGATTEALPADLHDQIYAYMSHLPQLIAFAAMPVLDARGIRRKDTDTLFTRFIRIGRSDPEMWRDVLLENAVNMLPAAAQVTEILTHMRDELVSGLKPDAAQPDEATAEKLAKDIWPRLLASSLIMAVQLAEKQMERKLARYAAGGFIDVTSPMMESPDPDFEIVSNYAAPIIAMLDEYLAHQAAIIAPLEAGDSATLQAELAVAQACGKRLIATVH